MSSKRGRELILWLLMACFAVAVHAQSASATMTGFVLDQSGAIIPNATVTLTNVNSGVVTTVNSNGAGLYRIQGLLPGTYRANVSAGGFKNLVRDGIDLHLEDEVSMNFSLGVGSVTETVTIQAGNELVETSSPTVSQVIEGEQVVDAPLNGRNVMNLVALTPGVVPQGASQGSVTQNQLGGFFTNSFGWGNYQIGGGLAGQSSEYLDGAPLNILYGHTSALVPTQDAIQEFRVESSVVNVRYGAFGGGVVSFVTKSGANDYHGTAYEYLRNTVLDANSFFNNLLGQPRPALIQNQFGANVGGRLVRDKAFWFFAYEGFRQILQIPNAGRIPTPAELSGNFTADAPIYDPTTGHQFECNNVLNMICPNRFDPTSNVMASMIHYWPTPNTNSSTINYSRNGAAGSNNDQYNGRGDWNVGKQKIFGRYTYWNAVQKPTQFFFGTNGPNSGPAVFNNSKQIVLGDTYVPTSSTILDARISYLRYVTAVTPADENVNLSEFGPFYSAITNQVTAKTYPNVIVAGTVGQPYNFLNVLNGSPFNNFAFSGTLTHLVGRHSFMFGGEGRRQEQYFNQTISPTGFFVFAGIFTGCATSCTTPSGAPATPTPPGGGATPISDFLLGQITSSPLGFTEVVFPSMVSNYGGIFASDTYKVGSKLTLTYGVRWEMPGGFVEKHDRNTVLLPELANPLVLVNSPNYPSRSDLEAHRTLFSPRVGAVYGLTPSIVLRAGYSLAYLPQDSVYDAASSSPIIAATTFVPSGNYISAPLGVGDNTLLEPTGRAYNGTQFLGSSISSRIPSEHFPYMQQWSADYQQTFGSRTSLDLGYVGNRVDHLAAGELSIDINQLPDQYDGLPASSLSQNDRPYPNYQTVNAVSPFVGENDYNSFQATLKRQFSGGGTLLANYTWSRLMGNSEAATAFVEQYSVGAIQDYDNLHGEISRLSFDTPQRLVISYVLDLPFGHGKAFLSSATGVTQGVLGGWNVSGITTFASGFPLAISAAANTLANVYGAGTIRPNYVAGCHKSVGGSLVTASQNSTPLLNQLCFTQPGDTSFGDEPRVDPSLRAQGQDNWDFALAKKTTIYERLNLEFRAEAFNIVNRVQFGEPNTTSGGALFGVVSAQNNNPRVLQFSLRTNF